MNANPSPTCESCGYPENGRTLPCDVRGVTLNLCGRCDAFRSQWPNLSGAVAVAMRRPGYVEPRPIFYPGFDA